MLSTKKAGSIPARLPRFGEKKLVRFQPKLKSWSRVVPEGMTPRKDGDNALPYRSTPLTHRCLQVTLAGQIRYVT